MIGFRCQHILEAYRQTFVAKFRRLVDPFRVIADDLPLRDNVLLQKLAGSAKFCGHSRPDTHFAAKRHDLVGEESSVVKLAG